MAKRQKKVSGAGVPIMAQWLTNPTRNHEVVGLIPGLAQWVNDLVLRELWCRLQTRLGSGAAWLWCRPVATAPIRPLAWEPPYATGAALKRGRKEGREGGRKGGVNLRIAR